MNSENRLPKAIRRWLGAHRLVTLPADGGESLRIGINGKVRVVDRQRFVEAVTADGSLSPAAAIEAASSAEVPADAGMPAASVDHRRSCMWQKNSAGTTESGWFPGGWISAVGWFVGRSDSVG